MPGTSKDGVRRLRRLIDDSIDGAAEADAVSMTKDREQSLIVSLSQVLREIRRWNHEQQRDSGLEDDGDEVEDERKESEEIDSRGGWLKLDSEDEDCLLKILAKLIFLVNAESQYVRQLAGNTLVAASEFIASSVRVWQKFIHLLCDCVVLAFSNILPYSSPLAFEVGKLSCDRSTFDVLNSQLKNSSWNTGAGILGVFHAILKYLKEQNDKHLLESYMNALDSCISKFSWEMLDTILVRRSYMDCINSGKGTFLTKHPVQSEPRILFLGNLVQLLSSLVDPIGLGEAPADSQYKNPILHNVLDLVPKVLHWCLHVDWKWNSLQIFLYLRHKTLMLMIRLSYQIRFESTTLFLWLELLHEYFKDLLMEPIYLLHSSVDNSLEGSPFQSSFDNQETKHPSRHLRGQALFLFLRCCLGLISHQEAPGFDCICMQQTSCSTPNVNTAEDCCARSRGLLQLYEWLQVQVSFDMVGQLKVHVKNCIAFSSFFIQLYMHEDDMLFEVLLFLLSIFNCADQRVAKVVPGSQDAKDDALSHVSNFFNPVILFFVFLANLQYDHQLLLDYLISKDTGTNCAEYLLRVALSTYWLNALCGARCEHYDEPGISSIIRLLMTLSCFGRCLREVCSSWDFFLDLSSDQDTVGHICKRPRLISKCLVSNEEGSSACGEDGCALPFEEHNNDYNPAGNWSGYESLDFGAAKSCLISLKDALEKLHRKNLFPYNPKVLLKSMRMRLVSDNVTLRKALAARKLWCEVYGFAGPEYRWDSFWLQEQELAEIVQPRWNWRKYGQKPIKGSPYPRSSQEKNPSKHWNIELRAAEKAG
ncbi:hypothetical protein AKJ16_DCAP17481 [Drosera capensis]